MDGILILRVERVGTDSAVIPVRKRLLTHRALMRSIVGMHIVDVPCKMVCTPETCHSTGTRTLVLLPPATAINYAKSI
jgi:hypothetical protein